MNNSVKKIGITTGDVNGIGAEITIKALNAMGIDREKILLISNKEVLNFYGKLDIQYPIEEIPFDKNKIMPGKITSESGEFSFRSIERACELANEGKISAIVTAPVAKIAMHEAGHFYNGQTEVLQKFLAKDNQKAEMLFVAKDFRVLLLTRHIALKDINITREMLINKITFLNEFFKSKFRILEPRFALCALNPHAGEDGIMGEEEQNVIIPTAVELRKKGISVTDPLPADTLFIKAAKYYLDSEMDIKSGTKAGKGLYDCYIAMYHDQGLIPIKTVAADDTVNMTIGLDVIRTSPSHGTAFDIAGKNIASEMSMISAIKQAVEIIY